MKSFNEKLKEAKKNCRNCERCGGAYTTGKFYEDYWCEIGHGKETKGLCPLCNPKSIFFINKTK